VPRSPVRRSVPAPPALCGALAALALASCGMAFGQPAIWNTWRIDSRRLTMARPDGFIAWRHVAAADGARVLDDALERLWIRAAVSTGGRPRVPRRPHMRSRRLLCSGVGMVGAAGNAPGSARVHIAAGHRSLRAVRLDERTE
jgi:hypothetical protein